MLGSAQTMTLGSPLQVRPHEVAAYQRHLASYGLILPGSIAHRSTADAPGPSTDAPGPSTSAPGPATHTPRTLSQAEASPLPKRARHLPPSSTLPRSPARPAAAQQPAACPGTRLHLTYADVCADVCSLSASALSKTAVGLLPAEVQQTTRSRLS